MIKSTSIFTTSLSALVIACALAAISVQPAAAQTAGNLKCKGCVNSKDIKNGQVKRKDLGSSAVTGAKIAAGAVATSDLADNAVSSAKLQDGAVNQSKLAPSVKPAGVDFVTAAPDGILLAASAGADTIVASVTVTAPAAGFVIVNANGWLDYNTNAGHVLCSVTTGVSVQSSSAIRSRVETVTTAPFVPMARTRVFPVAGPGSATYNLVCEKQSGIVDINDVVMSALYVPQQY